MTNESRDDVTIDDDAEREHNYPHAGDMRDLALMIDRLAIRLGDVKKNGAPSWSKLGMRVSAVLGSDNRTLLYDIRSGTAPKPTTLRALAEVEGAHVDEWYAAAGWPTGATTRVINTLADLDQDELDILRAAQRLTPSPASKQLVARVIEAVAAMDAARRATEDIAADVPDAGDS